MNNGVKSAQIPKDVFAETRYSILLLSIMLALFDRSIVYPPGGCVLGGDRPIDFYIDGLTNFGVRFETDGEALIASVQNRGESHYTLDYPSVGATEALLLFAAFGDNNRTLSNCAAEPEVRHLVDFLNAVGAKIRWTGTRSVEIEGVKELLGTTWPLMPDRIEAGTFAFLAAAIKADIDIRPVLVPYCDSVCHVLGMLGVPYEYHPATTTLRVFGTRCKKMSPIEVDAQPFPGFPTDLQPILVSTCLGCSGVSRISESVFLKRFKYLVELRKFGALVQVEKNVAVVQPSMLVGAIADCQDIRGAAACLIAALQAEGISRLGNSGLDRGYDRLLPKLRGIGISCGSDVV